MRAYRPSFVMQEEEKLMKEYMNLDDDIEIDDFINQYASDKYKSYIRKKRQEDKEYFEQGIIVN